MIYKKLVLAIVPELTHPDPLQQIIWMFLNNHKGVARTRGIVAVNLQCLSGDRTGTIRIF